MGLGRRGRVVLASRQAGSRPVHPAPPRDRRRKARHQSDLPSTSSAFPSRRSRVSCGRRSSEPREPAAFRPIHTIGSSTRAARACVISFATAAATSGRIPDAVVRPNDEPAVAAVLRAGMDADAVLIPFGGGTNISGSLEAPEARVAHDHLRRPRQAQPRAGDRRRLAPRSGAERRARPAPRGAAERSRLDPRPLPRQLHALHARRMGGHPLVGHAVRPVRRRGRPDPCRAGGHARGNAGHAAGAQHVDRPERARDGAGQRGTARDHHRGHGPRSPPAGASHDPRLPVSDLGGGARRDARDRRRRGLPVGHARVGRLRDAVLVRHQDEGLAARPAQVEGAPDVPRATQELRPRGDVPVVPRLRGDQGPRGRAAQARGEDRQPPRRVVHRHRARGSVRPEEVRHAVHPRLPARPGRAGRRLGDVRAVERACPGSTTT